MMMKINCAHCGKEAKKHLGEINRASKKGAPLFCSKDCFGLSRRQNKSQAQLKEERRQYGMDYRAKNREMLKAKKKEYFQRTYDPEKAAIKRQVKMAAHIEYCRQPEYRAYKKKYDRKYRAENLYGEFGEAYSILLDIDREVNSRMSDYEVRVINGTLNKQLQRKRSYERIISLKSQNCPLGSA